ncbi:MAG TPA: hypothetical protein VJ921_09345, partial [Vicinamibacteria bacterium]|nr:hypothetical protein [Vicinamibacteria bacterium]
APELGVRFNRPFRPAAGRLQIGTLAVVALRRQKSRCGARGIALGDRAELLDRLSPLSSFPPDQAQVLTGFKVRGILLDFAPVLFRGFVDPALRFEDLSEVVVSELQIGSKLERPSDLALRPRNVALSEVDDAEAVMNLGEALSMSACRKPLRVKVDCF